jgi:hypothetical protein
MVVPSQPGELLLSMYYPEVDQVLIFDNHVLGWVVDSAEPQGAEPIPRIIGALPPAAEGPQWASVMANGTVFVPDLYRGSATDFFSWLAALGDGYRLNGDGLTVGFLATAWRGWAGGHGSQTF